MRNRLGALLVGLVVVTATLADGQLEALVREVEREGLRVLSAERVEEGGVVKARLKVMNDQQRVRVISRPLPPRGGQ